MANLQKYTSLTKFRKTLLTIAAWALIGVPDPAYGDYPEIHFLNGEDVLYSQLQNDIAVYHRAEALADRSGVPSLTFFEYTLKKGDDLLSLAARLNLPYDTLATLNELENPADISPPFRILIPNLPGIFVPREPESELSRLMLAWRMYNAGEAVEVLLVVDDRKRDMLFFQGDRFHPLERAFFLRILFRFPLPGATVTSRFGPRSDPFSGHPQFHNGVDLAAPVGTEVYAARDGKVREAGYSETFGNYVLLAHEGGYLTLYGHLSALTVGLNQSVTSGMIIGRVGSTGRSTGPHLHFEIRRGDSLQDPSQLMPFELDHDD